MSKSKVKAEYKEKLVKMPMSLYRAICKESQKRSNKAKRKVYENTVIVEGLTSIFLPKDMSITHNLNDQ